jgi:hypothetical protein
MPDLFLAYCTMVLWHFCQKQTPKILVTVHQFQNNRINVIFFLFFMFFEFITFGVISGAKAGRERAERDEVDET